VSHLPLGPRLSVADIEIEQELDRPFVYIARMVYGPEGEKGTDIISIADPANLASVLAENLDQQLAEAVDDLRLLAEVGRAVDHADHFHELDDLVEAAEGVAYRAVPDMA